MILLTSPHSGEVVPLEAQWLRLLPQILLLTDVDRFVDQLYEEVARNLALPLVRASVHRYAVDLNRLPEDIDSSVVVGAKVPSQTAFVSGIHWKKTTTGVELMPQPMPWEIHDLLIKNYFHSFHSQVLEQEQALIQQHGLPRYHLDLHSMPSRGTGAHRDSGAMRPDVVISDCEGSSCSAEFKDAVINAFQSEGFSVSYNWPYKGGRLTQTYGRPKEHRHSLQVELNRSLYMDEQTREKSKNFTGTKARLESAVIRIFNWVAAQRKELGSTFSQPR